MKFMKVLMTVIALTTLYTNDLDAQNKSSKISGVFLFPTIDSIDEVDVRTARENIYWADLIPNRNHIDDKNRFVVNFSKVETPLLIQIDALKSGKYLKEFGKYYLEPNDDVFIKIFKTFTGDSLVFNGKGAEKYNLIEELNRQEKHFKKRWLTLTSPTTSQELEIYLSSFETLILEHRRYKDALVNSYKGVSDDLKILINYQFANYTNYWYRTLFYFRVYEPRIANGQSQKILKDASQKYIKKVKSDSLVPISVNAPDYYRFMAEEVKTKMLLDSNKTDMTSYYRRLKLSCSGVMRERLLVEFFVSTVTMIHISDYSSVDYDLLVSDALKTVKYSNPYYQNLIEEKLRIKKGSKLFHADFIDLNGKKFQLNSLKGKVVLLDLWSDGCGGCATFHARFEKEIYPLFKDTFDFQVLSINANTSRERWIKALASNNYSSIKYKNVNVGEVGKHPFINYYTNVLPFILILDKESKIVTRLFGAEESKDIIEIINTELNKNTVRETDTHP